MLLQPGQGFSQCSNYNNLYEILSWLRQPSTTARTRRSKAKEMPINFGCIGKAGNCLEITHTNPGEWLVASWLYHYCGKDKIMLQSSFIWRDTFPYRRVRRKEGKICTWHFCMVRYMRALMGNREQIMPWFQPLAKNNNMRGEKIPGNRNFFCPISGEK